MPQMLNGDGSRDLRFSRFETPSFGPWQTLTNRHSNYYEGNNAPSASGVYQIATTTGLGRPNIRYSGMSNDVHSRVNDHGRANGDNLDIQFNQARNRGISTMVRASASSSAYEARAQELQALDSRNFSWNHYNNGGIDGTVLRKSSEPTVTPEP
ncbi:unnamed protein product [Didymodactylos carnosus]|uniref:Uncharacterized protein n=1 Tax=Didymodactylos carnosus TaxID=1234261 RepID=A0A8S2E2H9_9BILA|nr:unnamed protein product [Didymodactylos carnosus]CAF3829252.1 unnamed protein product [Didymodactylos carnosus]